MRRIVQRIGEVCRGLKVRSLSADSANAFIAAPGAQIRAWRKANKKMGWGITEEEFAAIGAPSQVTDQERKAGFVGSVLFYGFGDDGTRHADAVLSGGLSWDYAVKSR